MTSAVPAPDLFDDAGLSEPVAGTVRGIALAGFHALWAGQPVRMPQLLDHDPVVLAEAVDHLQRRGRIELDDDGYLIAVHGLCRRPTPHRIEHHGLVVNTWCALDAIGIPAALEIDARAITSCPTCQAQLTVGICGGEPQPLPETTLWFPEVTCGHLVEDFCSGANLFCTLDHLERWTGASGPAGRAISLEEVAEIGRQGWADVAELLRPDTPEHGCKEGRTC